MVLLMERCWSARCGGKPKSGRGRRLGRHRRAAVAEVGGVKDRPGALGQTSEVRARGARPRGHILRVRHSDTPELLTSSPRTAGSCGNASIRSARRALGRAGHAEYNIGRRAARPDRQGAMMLQGVRVAGRNRQYGEESRPRGSGQTRTRKSPRRNSYINDMRRIATWIPRDARRLAARGRIRTSAAVRSGTAVGSIDGGSNRASCSCPGVDSLQGGAHASAASRVAERE